MNGSSARREAKAEAIVTACLRCIARDGYAATSMASIAREAGVDKRLVAYYHGSREQLLDQVVRHVADQLIARLRAAIHGIDDPVEIAQVGFDRIWKSLTTDRALLVAWLAIKAEAVANVELQEGARYLNDGFRDVIREASVVIGSRGFQARMSMERMTLMIVASIQGLVMEWLAYGDTPELAATIADFQAWIGSFARPVPAAP